MTKIERDENREERIDMEVVVDAYDEEERAMGWYYYLAVYRKLTPLTLTKKQPKS
jgi:endonuclease I